MLEFTVVLFDAEWIHSFSKHGVSIKTGKIKQKVWWERWERKVGNV